MTKDAYGFLGSTGSATVEVLTPTSCRLTGKFRKADIGERLYTGLRAAETAYLAAKGMAFDGVLPLPTVIQSGDTIIGLQPIQKAV